MTKQTDRNEARHQLIKIAFGAMALLCVLAGFAVYLLADWLGLSEDTARIVAIAFLVAGAGDYLILRLWDRIAARN
jgi:TRAP-type C4-dicarboxylate transport system permease small subunit